MLTWSSTNSTGCTAGGAGWSGSRAVSGSESVGPLSSDQTFTLTCTGAGGSDNGSVAITVDTSGPAPTVSISASDTSIDSGDSITLTWSSTDATSCTASGATGWTGSQAVSGSETFGPLTSSQTYALTCTGTGGSDNGSVAVTVDASGPAPTVSLSATNDTVDGGSSTNLTWSSQDADTCTASGGGWSGTRAVSGNESTGALQNSTSYSLTCTGTGGSALAIVTVGVRQTVSVNWDAPTENDDGSPLNDLSGFRLYVGASSGSYGAPTEVPGASSTSSNVTLDPGVHYLVVTAITTGGTESNNSNEVALTVQ